MKTVFSPLHTGHSGQMELIGGAIVPGFEKPSRAEIIKARIEAQKLGPIIEPQVHDLAAARRVHREDYVDFLPTAYDLWKASGRDGSAIAFTWPTRGLRADVRPGTIDALLGFYSFDGGASLVEGSWEAIKSSYDVALTAAAPGQRGRTGRVRPVPSARPPRRRGLHGRLLLPQQRGGRGAMVPRQRRAASPSSMSTITTATARRRSSTSAPTFSSSTSTADPMTEYPVLPRPRHETGAGAGRRLQSQLPDAARDRLGQMERIARRCLRKSSPPTRPTWSWSRSASTRSRRIRSASSS